MALLRGALTFDDLALGDQGPCSVVQGGVALDASRPLISSVGAPGWAVT